jgi:hypothetical protein
VRGFKLSGGLVALELTLAVVFGERELAAQLRDFRLGGSAVDAVVQTLLVPGDHVFDPLAPEAHEVLAVAVHHLRGQAHAPALELALDRVAIDAAVTTRDLLAVALAQPEVDVDLSLRERAHQAEDRAALIQAGLHGPTRHQVEAPHLELVAHDAVPPRLTFEEDHRGGLLGHHVRVELAERGAPRVLRVRVLAPARGVTLAIVTVPGLHARARRAGEVIPLLGAQPRADLPPLQLGVERGVAVEALGVAAVVLAVGHADSPG